MEALLKNQGCAFTRYFSSQENGGREEMFVECPCTPQGEFGRRKVPGKCTVEIKVAFVPEKTE
ncbi:hypothetical protein ISTM_264 [Insectomime virus]|uniref:Uncharacterized protein n=1 Tax=Tunisvirus fontaine2 TaxID=1421067 RepID=V9SEM9_9VIRU|nr:hypothetical protein D1R32_gp049 [Tunisvirus fontaine2]AHA46162.1 hypothetical protein ISTM_264 [Insectomime virus]AHC54766.1 hypothetical protein TNS_ORF48 [Tunisvirus fontaine2]